jgi:hypothetical protein
MSSRKSLHNKDLMENSYYYFVKTLSILTESPAEQCAKMGDYNTPFELRDDGLVVDYLIDQEIVKFTDDQIEGMKELSLALHALSGEVLKGGHTREDNLKGMNNPRWQSVREIAKRLLATLAPRTLENRKYLNMSS